MEKGKLIQVGIKVLRRPNGDFEKAMPIYMDATPELLAREKAIISAIEAVDAYYLKEYIEKCEKVAKQTRRKAK